MPAFHSNIFPYLESNTQSWLPYYNALVYSLYIKSNSSLFWFIVHALLKGYGYLQYQQSPFQGALTHTQDTPTRHPYYSPMHPHQWDVRVKTLKIRQLLGDRVVDLFFNFFFFLKREKHGGIHLAIIILMKFVYINIYMAVTLNIPFTFYIHRMTSRFRSQQNIPTSVSMLLVVTSEFT